MEVFQLLRGRYLLYLDILGFKQLVSTESEHRVYETLDTMLQEFKMREDRIRDFGTLYFSDTIIFYQKSEGFGEWAFLDSYAIAGMAWCALAAIGIPCRGAISFGDFTVRSDSRSLHSVFFGNALIDAYEVENASDNRDWIGITLCPSAWQAMDQLTPGLIDAFGEEGRWRKHGNCLRLNPFMRLKGVYDDVQIGEVEEGSLSNWIAPDFPDEIRALDFIFRSSQRFRERHSPPPFAAKYDATRAEFSEMINARVIEWALRLADTWRQT